MYLVPGFLAQVTAPLKDRNVASCGEGRGLQGKARPATGRVRIAATRKYPTCERKRRELTC